MSDVPNKPTVDYPSPSTILDTILVERTSNKIGTYRPIEPGAPFKKGTHTAKELADFADVEFVAQKATADNEWLQRIFATQPSTQDIANFEQGYLGEDNAYPTFLRRYMEKRDSYTPRTKLQPLAGLYRINVTAAGTGYTSAPTISFSGGTGSGGSAIAVLNNSGGIAKITLKSEGTWTVAPTVVISGGGGSGGTATAYVQPQTCVLTVEKTGEAPAPYNSLYILVQRLYETLPGPYLPDRDYDPLLGPVQVRRRAVIFTTQTASESATGSITYKARDENAAVSWEIERIWSDGTGTAGNPPYRLVPRAPYDDERGSITGTEQLVVITSPIQTSTQTSDGTTVTKTTYEPYNDFLMKKVVETWPATGTDLGGVRMEDSAQGAFADVSRKLIDSGTANYTPTWRTLSYEDQNVSPTQKRRTVVTLSGSAFPILTEYDQDEETGALITTTYQVVRAASVTAPTFVIGEITKYRRIDKWRSLKIRTVFATPPSRSEFRFAAHNFPALFNLLTYSACIPFLDTRDELSSFTHCRVDISYGNVNPNINGLQIKPNSFRIGNQNIKDVLNDAFIFEFTAEGCGLITYPAPASTPSKATYLTYIDKFQLISGESVLWKAGRYRTTKLYYKML